MVRVFMNISGGSDRPLARRPGDASRKVAAMPGFSHHIAGMRAPACVLAATLAACMEVTTGTGTGQGAGGQAGGATSAGGGDAGVAGANCFEDPSSQITLCEQIGACPGVVVEPGSFPNCGFRVGGPSPLDLECLCDNALCPVGVPGSCAQAAQLLEGQSALVVCEQQAEGRCISLGVPDAGAASTCDKTCEGDCSGDPSCIQLCGC